MTGDLADRTHAVGPTAQQVVDGDTWAVEVDLNPVGPDLLVDLARALHRAGRAEQFRRLGIMPAGVSALELTAAIHGDPNIQTVLRVPVHPDAAERLSSELYDALTEPDVCTWRQGDCCNYVGTDPALCDLHHEGTEVMSEQINRTARG